MEVDSSRGNVAAAQLLRTRRLTCSMLFSGRMPGRLCNISSVQRRLLARTYSSMPLRCVTASANGKIKLKQQGLADWLPPMWRVWQGTDGLWQKQHVCEQGTAGVPSF